MSSPSSSSFLALAILGSVASTACSDTVSSPDIDDREILESAQLKTSELRATFRLSGFSQGDKATLEALVQFEQVGRGDTEVELTGEDAVYCDGVELSKHDTTANAAEVPRKPVGEPYHFELRRSGGESVVVDVTRADDVVVSAPIAATEVQRLQPLNVQWTPAVGTSINVQLFANCAMTNVSEGAESGNVTLPAFVPQGIPGGPQNAANAPCDGVVSLNRTRTGYPTTALGGTQTVAEEFHQLPVHVTD